MSKNSDSLNLQSFKNNHYSCCKCFNLRYFLYLLFTVLIILGKFCLRNKDYIFYLNFLGIFAILLGILLYFRFETKKHKLKMEEEYLKKLVETVNSASDARWTVSDIKFLTNKLKNFKL